MKTIFKNIIDVARWRLCVGCGACASICPEDKIELVDIENDGIRPVLRMGVKENECDGCGECLDVCPGIGACAGHPEEEGGISNIQKFWGNVLEIWEGYALDPEIRCKGSSGGICTALSVFCTDNEVAEGVLHTCGNSGESLRNTTVRSLSRKEMIDRTGSRYSPASPCDGLKIIEREEHPSVFIGKPCDLQGLRKTQNIRPVLAEKTALAIGFFCAGTPSTLGTLELLRTNGVNTEQVEDLRYRGIGWPGHTTVKMKSDGSVPMRLSYEQSWGFIQKYRPFRCYLCPDLTAEFADISVGDPWYRDPGDDDPGRSLILIRTGKGRKFFHQAMEKGYVSAERADPALLFRSQKNLLGKRQAIWGRLFAMKLMGVPRPEFSGFHLFNNWLDLSPGEKLKSVLGTVKRIVQRNYRTGNSYYEKAIK
jgi:coenzyme F420 hydrogenase subunit beta